NLMVTQPGDFLKENSLASILSFSYKINKHITFNSGYLNLNTWQTAAEHGIKNYITNDSANLYYTNWNYNTVTNTLTNYFTFDFNTGSFGHKLLVGHDYVRSRVNLGQTSWELPDQFGVNSGIVGTFSLVHPEYFHRPVSTYQVSNETDDANQVNASIYHTQGVYLQEQLSMDRWKLLIGLRKEFYQGDDVTDSASNFGETVLLPRVGLIYQLNSNINLYASYNKGFDPFESSGEVQIFKEPFKPITSQLYEAGAKASFFRNKLSASAAIYELTLQNVAVNANDPSNPDLFVQRGEDQSKGVELEANGNILPNLSINLAYAYNVAKIVKSEVHNDVGKIKENAPRHSSSSWIKYSFNKGRFHGFSLAFGHSQASLRNTLVDGFTVPGFVVFNAGIQYVYRKFSIFANLNNIANTTYWSSAYNNINKWPGSPRNFMINLGYRF
ncbi:MAG TPA: TonB-dependent receptor, partial [Puia sp.]|nr:TonB-dependent receptor [Puia sp.]